MAKLTILTKNTVAKSILKGVSLGLAGIMIYGGVMAVNHRNAENKYNDRLATIEDSIKRAVTNEDYGTALSTLKRVESKEILKDEDEVRLGAYIKRMSADYVIDQEKKIKQQEIDVKKEGLETKFDIAFANNDASKSLDAVNNMRESGLFDKKFLEFVNGQAVSITEDGIIKEMLGTALAERGPVAEKYLKIYPKGDHRLKAIESLLTGELSRLSTFINQKASYDQTFSQLQHLNQVFDKYSGANIKMPDVVDIEDFSNSSENYLENLLGVGDKLVKGLTVKTVFVSNEVTNYKDDYVDDRNQAVPLGSVGKVMNFDEDEVYVKFGSMDEPKWGKDWQSCAPYWKESGRKDVAAFDPKELLAISTLNDVQKNMFRIEFKKFKAAFDEYR